MNAPSRTLSGSPIHLLHRAGQCAVDVFGEVMHEDKDLTPRQFAVLTTVAANEGISQTGLVEQTGIDRSTLADIVRRMLKKGLLQRRRTKEDARAYAVKLTDLGKATLKGAELAASEADERLLQMLPVKLRAQFLDALKRIVEGRQTAKSGSGGE